MNGLDDHITGHGGEDYFTDPLDHDTDTAAFDYQNTQHQRYVDQCHAQGVCPTCGQEYADNDGDETIPVCPCDPRWHNNDDELDTPPHHTATRQLLRRHP